MSADSHQPIPAEILDAASAWLARRDRGLNAAEQDEYLHWLRADPRHAEALAQHAAALERMMQLYEWTPAHDTEPNPDLFAPVARPTRAPWRVWLAPTLAAAAAVALAFVLWKAPAEPATVASAPKSYLRVNERMALPDGSRVELKDGTQLVVQYSERERRVQLTGGEAHFSVWKDPQRPFIVSAAGVEVRAVGTAFNVRIADRDLSVLVTEGRVGVRTLAPEDGGRKTEDGSITSGQSSVLGSPSSEIFVTVGQRAIVDLATLRTETVAPPVVQPVTVEDIARELSWQAPRLQFDETPLVDAVAEFNRLNRHQLELADPALGDLRIGGTFRPDNVEAFVRLLDETLGLQAERVGDNRTRLRSR